MLYQHDPRFNRGRIEPRRDPLDRWQRRGGVAPGKSAKADIPTRPAPVERPGVPRTDF